jgi:16S rRNA (guanine527-N7)-methyltransferase
MANREFRDRLRRRAAAANVTIDPAVEASLEAFYLLLAKWNSKINLTAFQLTPDGDDPSIDRLLIEPLVAAQFLPAKAERWLDAGSGGGSPAIPIKLAAPRLKLQMVEAKTRKAAFLREAVRTLALQNAEVETSRFQVLLTRPELHETVDIVTIRAVRLDLPTLMTLQAFLKRGGRLLHLRGAEGGSIDGVAAALELADTHSLLKSNQSRLAIYRKVRN